MASKQYRVVIVGSSGGGKAGLGAQDTYGLLCAIRTELHRAGITLGAVQVVDCSVPLDIADDAARAVLWVLSEAGQITIDTEGPLSHVNRRASTVDRLIGRAIESEHSSKRIDGMISFSSDPLRINQFAFLAASRTQIPVVGTGGTSLVEAAKLNVNIIGNSGGSVATTASSRAMSFAASLAGWWDLEYSADKVKLSLHSVFGGLVPAFIAIMCFNQIVQSLQRHAPEWVLQKLMLGDKPVDLSFTLPVVSAAVMTNHVANMGEISVTAGLLAGVITEGNVFAGLLVGAMTGVLCRHALVALSRSTHVPATATTIMVGGFAGVATGLLGRVVARWPTERAMEVLQQLLVLLETPPSQALRTLSGAIIGCAMFYGSRHGAYHLIFLPLIIVEMHRGEPSFLGAVDFCVLVLICAGICAAELVVPSPDRPGLKNLARRGVLINLCWGDFVEAAYPVMDTDRWVEMAAYLAAMVSTALLSRSAARSSAYLPVFLSLWLAGGRANTAAAVAFGLPFVVAAVRNRFGR